ncbi:hypothetical protein RHGRI_037725 [Rhododendron griersonianum]|uniref:Leucine-rich repeat-containing N-terminal plant-type domain-containing protein n=1 Tax=Rhododendron griersonianum TaxID=479676 RepID=A0AAV6HX32_9ERIC|nr:hypothetical protein RHGRI_037725 [Rhododendron griersonianum]
MVDTKICVKEEPSLLQVDHVDLDNWVLLTRDDFTENIPSNIREKEDGGKEEMFVDSPAELILSVANWEAITFGIFGLWNVDMPKTEVAYAVDYSSWEAASLTVSAEERALCQRRFARQFSCAIFNLASHDPLSTKVNAINSLYSALDFPLLPGWSPLGGDPCGDGWQGVQCVNANITGIVLNGANLGGALSNDLGDFSAIIQMSFNDNHLTGGIPDAFQTLTGLITLDLSGNNLSSQLPPSMGSLSSLTTLSVVIFMESSLPFTTK